MYSIYHVAAGYIGQFRLLRRKEVRHLSVIKNYGILRY